MSSVSAVSPEKTAAPSAPASSNRGAGPFSRMLATTLASFTGAGDPVRNRATQATRTWQTQKQLARQFDIARQRPARDAADIQAADDSRADQLREKRIDELSDQSLGQGGQNPSSTDTTAESLEMKARREQHHATSSAEQTGSGHASTPNDQTVAGIREKRAVQASLSGSLQTTSTSSKFQDPVNPFTPVEPDPASGALQVGAPRSADAAPGVQADVARPDASNLNPSTSVPQTSKPTAENRAGVESAHAATKAAASAPKSSGSTTSVQDLLASAGAKKADLEGAKASKTLNRAATPQTQRGIDITQAKAMQELANIVRSRINARESNILLQLDPPELGKVRIDLNMKHDVLTLRIEAQTQAGHEALQSRISELRHALEQHGITINRVEVELNSPVTTGNDTHQAHYQHPDSATQEQAYQQASPQGSQQSQDGGQAQGDGDGDRQPGTEQDAGVSAGSMNEMEYGDFPAPAETGLDLVV